MKVHIDFETRSTVDIWESGAWVYSAHPSTKILCVATAVDGDKVEISTDYRSLTALAENPDAIFVAHNAIFEQCIWKNIMVPQYGLPPIPIQRWRCTMAKACAYGLPKALGKAADALNLGSEKDKAGRGIMLRMAKPLKKGGNEYDDSPANYKLLFEYCKQDVRVERDLDNRLPDLSKIEQEIWFYDQLINMRGVSVDMESVKTFISILENKTEQLNKELVSITGGKVTKGTQVASMLTFLNEGGAGMTTLDKQSVAEAIKANKLTPQQIQILRLRQQLGKSSLAKYKKLVDAAQKYLDTTG